MIVTGWLEGTYTLGGSELGYREGRLLHELLDDKLLSKVGAFVGRVD